MDFLARLPFIAFFVGVFVFYHGLVLYILWGWFAVPIYNLPEISLFEAMGTMTIVGFVVNQYIPIPDDKTSESFIMSIITPAISLLIGGIIHLFI